MAVQLHELVFWLSGGSSNTDPNASLGGSRSTNAAARVKSQTTSALTNVTGVTIANAFNNPVGVGTIRWDNSLSKLQWKPYGALTFNSVDVSGDGTYVVGNASGYIECVVVAASLPVSTQQDTDIAVTNILNGVFDSVSAAESTSGLIEYRCLYVRNLSSTDTAFDVRLWIEQQPVGPDELDIALDPAGAGNGTSTGVATGPLADEEDTGDALAAFTWSRPSTQENGLLLGNLAAGQSYAFWQRRTVLAETTQQVSNDTSIIGLSALI